MFDLEDSIARWRQRMLEGGMKSPAVLDELESHLREALDQQVKTGDNLKAAFESAASQIGDPQDLKAEFERASGFPRLYLYWFCCLSAPLLVFVNLCVLQPGEVSPEARLAGLTLMVMAVLYISGLPFLYRRLPGFHNPFIRIIMLLGYMAALGWPLLATVLNLSEIRLASAPWMDMVVWSLGSAWFATWLAYWVTGEVGIPPAAREQSR